MASLAGYHNREDLSLLYVYESMGKRWYVLPDRTLPKGNSGWMDGVPRAFAISDIQSCR